MAKAKFRLEGEDATAAAFRSALGNAKGTADGIGKAFKYAFAGISISAITGVAARAIEMGDELNKAAIKAGIGGRAISELAHAASMADVELGALSGAIRKMQVAISEANTGGKKQIETLDALGIELAELKGLKADQQFERIAEAISLLRSSEDKARAATDLFGKSGADLLPMFEQGAAGIRAAREEADALGKSFSDEQIAKLAAADDAVKRLTASWEGFAAVMTAKVTEPLIVVMGLLSGQAESKGFDELSTTHIDKLLERARKARPSAKRDETIAKFEARKRELLAEQNAANALRPVVKAGVGYTDTGATDAASKAQAKAAAESLKERQKLAEDIARLNRDTMEQIESDTKDAMESVGETMRDEFSTMVDGMHNTEAFWAETLEGMSVYADEAARDMKDALADFLFDPFENGLKGMLKSFINTLRRMIAEAAAAKIMDSIAGLASGGSGGFGDFLGSMFGGGRAAGGSVQGGKTYLVGERGPELLTMGGNGHITPNHAMRGGAPVINVNIHAPNSTRESVSDLKAMVPSIVQQAVQLSRMAVADDLSRGAFAR